MNKQQIVIVFIALVAVAVFGRLVPHVANFAPVAAAGLLAGYLFRAKFLAMMVPVTAMIISDRLFFGGYGWAEMLLVYAGLAVSPLLGSWLRKPVSAKSEGMRSALRVLKLIGTAGAGSLAFYAISNFGTWYFSGMYAQTWDGFVACYVAALPFLKTSALADLVFSGVLFGAATLVGRAYHAHKLANA